MKKLFFAGSLFLITACATVDARKNASIVRDCTGTYLRMEAKDYLVCNDNILKPFATGTQVSASFDKILDCKEFEGKMACMMYHAHEGLIRITSVE